MYINKNLTILLLKSSKVLNLVEAIRRFSKLLHKQWDWKSVSEVRRSNWCLL